MEVPHDQDDDSLILVANQLSLITSDQSSSPVTAIKITTTRSSTGHLINCPLILAYAHAHTTLTTLTVNHSSKNINQLMYRLQ